MNPFDMLDFGQSPARQKQPAEPAEKPLGAIEYLEGQAVKITLRDKTSLQGQLQRIGWMSAESEAISYFCLEVDEDSANVLSAQGADPGSGIIFIPWDWIAYIVQS